MVSWLVLLVSVVCVASAPMDVETKVRARAAADPRCSLPPPPPLRPTFFSTDASAFRHVPVSSAPSDLQLASVASDAALPARWSGALKNTLAFARNNGNAATVLRQLRAMEKRVAAKKVRSRVVLRVRRRVGRAPGRSAGRLLRSGSTMSCPLRPAGRGRGCESAASLEGAAIASPISCRRGETCGVRGRTCRGLTPSGLAGRTMACYISIVALLSRSLGIPCVVHSRARHA